MTKAIAEPRELRRPSFIIGKVSGRRLFMISNMAMEIVDRYHSSVRKGTIKVCFPSDDDTAIAEAYRLGLAAAIVSEIEDEDMAERTVAYIRNAQKEEVWFWTSKFLNIAGECSKTQAVVRAISLVGGA